MVERSQDVFEEVGYAKPPLPPLPAVDDYEGLQRHGFVKVTERSRRVLRRALDAMGYPAFHATLPETIEDVLRRTNMREGRLFGPAYSATVALHDDPAPKSAIERAASLIVAARSLCDDVMHGRLPQDEMRGAPLEMGQYPNLFATSLRVEGSRAHLHKSSRFDTVGIVVARRLYTLRVGEVGEFSPAEIAASLADIVADAGALPPVHDDDAPTMASAGKDRTLSATLAEMERSPVSSKSLAALRDCFVVVCLDFDLEPRTGAEAARYTQAGNPANRWYLASLQLVVFGNAKASGICSFPAYLDGNVMMRAAAELKRRADGVHGFGGAGLRRPAYAALDWSIDRRRIRAAWTDVRSIVDSQRATFELEGVGRERFQACGLDPVNAFVVALAVATKRCSGKVVPILQLVTVSKFRCVPVGGADTMAPEVVAYVDATEGGTATRRDLESAVAAVARECRRERQGLSLRWSVEAFVRTRKGLSRARALAVLVATRATLRAMGDSIEERVIISHPEIFPEIVLLGRPGIRLPYVPTYGLHYQMFPERVVMTFMPGLSWKVPNVLFSREIERALQDVLAVAEGG